MEGHLTSNIGIRLFKTPLGWVAIAATARGLCVSVLPRPSLGEAMEELRQALSRQTLDLENAVSDFQQDLLDRAEGQLCAYYSGEPVRFDLPLDLSSRTPFQQRVMLAASGICWGETASYGEVARRLGCPKSARAVGQALGGNPLPPLVPCHRVIAADGSLGGFGGGLEMKKRLLALERKR